MTHRLKFYSLAILVIISSMTTSCIKFEDKDEDTEASDTLTTEEPVVNADTKKDEITSAVYVYNDTTGIPEKSAAVNAADATPEELVAVINKYTGNDKVVMEYVKKSGDTVFVKIPDSDYLTRQMGTLGAHAYMATATYTLTEGKDINYVDFDFEEGDHAAPGTYSTESFKPEPIN